MRTQRARLIVSHISPLLLSAPVLGSALVYIMETQVVLSSLSHDLALQAALTADLAREQPAIWSNSAEAHRFVTLYAVRSQSSVMLFDAEGNLLAASDPAYSGQLGQPSDLSRLSAALAGEQQVYVDYTRRVQAEIIQVLVPVVGPDQRSMGVIRVSQYLSGVQDQLIRLRYLVAGVLAGALLLAVIVGMVLALNLSRSLQRVTD